MFFLFIIKTAENNTITKPLQAFQLIKMSISMSQHNQPKNVICFCIFTTCSECYRTTVADSYTRRFFNVIKIDSVVRSVLRLLFISRNTTNTINWLTLSVKHKYYSYYIWKPILAIVFKSPQWYDDTQNIWKKSPIFLFELLRLIKVCYVVDTQLKSRKTSMSVLKIDQISIYCSIKVNDRWNAWAWMWYNGDFCIIWTNSTAFNCQFWRLSPIVIVSNATNHNIRLVWILDKKNETMHINYLHATKTKRIMNRHKKRKWNNMTTDNSRINCTFFLPLEKWPFKCFLWVECEAWTLSHFRCIVCHPNGQILRNALVWLYHHMYKLQLV